MRKFLVPDGVVRAFAAASAARAAACARPGARNSRRYRKQYPDLAERLAADAAAQELPEGWDADLPDFAADAKGIATRDSSGKVLNAIAPH